MDNLNDKLIKAECFHQNIQDELPKLIGEKFLHYATGLSYLRHDEQMGEMTCRSLQKVLEEKIPEAVWEIHIRESHMVLSKEDWIEHAINEATIQWEQEKTNHCDLDLNILQQLKFGYQLESFHNGEWGKNKILSLFKPSNFTEEVDPLQVKWKTPLPHLLAKMEHEMVLALVHNKHPYQCAVAIGVLCIRLPANEFDPERVIPLVRKVEVSNIKSVLELMKIDLKEHFESLNDAIQEQQSHLKMLPKGWPTDEVWDHMQQWTSKRFRGDNGFEGTELFHSNWVDLHLPDNVYMERLPEPEVKPEVTSEVTSEVKSEASSEVVRTSTVEELNSTNAPLSVNSEVKVEPKTVEEVEFKIDGSPSELLAKKRAHQEKKKIVSKKMKVG